VSERLSAGARLLWAKVLNPAPISYRKCELPSLQGPIVSEQTEHNGNTWSPRAKWTFAVFAIIGAFFLIAEHRAHILPFLPWLFLAACPLMHLFMHGGHGGHGGHRGHGGGNRPDAGSGSSTGSKPEGTWGGDAAPKEDSHRHHGGRP
jgi:hypothetical protein